MNLRDLKGTPNHIVEDSSTIPGVVNMLTALLDSTTVTLEGVAISTITETDVYYLQELQDHIKRILTPS